VSNMSEVADIEVKYVNPVKEGKRFATFKDGDGKLWLVQPGMIGQFAQGMKCKVEYQAGKFSDGTPSRKITKIIGSNGAVSIPQNNFRQRSNPAEAKQIAVLAIVKEWVGKIPVGDEASLVNAIKAAMRAYDKTLGGTVAQRQDDMDDEIPY